ncbi:MAG: glutamyl-tRNA synthetase [Geminicoccaceae bacterium]|nr:glutamyl-tRNA synthetase [Geminicoccaceae bacterium]
MLAEARAALAAVPEWEAALLEESLRPVAERRGIGAGKLFQPLRVALTGSSVSPGIFDVLVLLGRDRSLRRIDDALRNLDGTLAV